MTPRLDRSGGTSGQTLRTRHIPVLLSEILEAVKPRDGETYIDGTFGAGGYARALLEAAHCRVVAIDRDPSAIAGGQDLKSIFAGRLHLFQGRFGALDSIADEAGFQSVDGVVLDVGVSSMQLDEAGRGFSFQYSGPLDMRMSADGLTAAHVVNTFEEETLANIIFSLGEERRSRAVARAIVKARAEMPIESTRQLADVVLRVFGGRREDGRHPATRTFQALRIFINDELGELARGLAAAERCLAPGGRLVIVTFHSLEDRIVKRFLNARSGKEVHGSRHLPEISIKISPPSFRIVNTRPLTPSKGELDLNPRARSARLRAAVRTTAPAVPLDLEDLEVPQFYP